MHGQDLLRDLQGQCLTLLNQVKRVHDFLVRVTSTQKLLSFWLEGAKLA